MKPRVSGAPDLAGRGSVGPARRSLSEKSRGASTPPLDTTPAALGFRAHSGWAVVVAVAGPARAPRVIDRRRIELADPLIPGSKQPFHAAEGRDSKAAEEIIQRCTSSTRALSRRGVFTAIEDVRRAGHAIVGSGLLTAAGPSTKSLSLAEKLASHPRLHTAEGELFRDALVDASEHHHVPVTCVRERDLFVRAEADLQVSIEELRRRVQDLGRTLGPPWRQDEKLAALIGWLVLATPR